MGKSKLKTRRDRKEYGEAFTVSKGILRVDTDLYWEYLEEFDAACERLLDSRKKVLRVDLTEVSFISSSFVGCIGNLVLQASRLKKRVVLRVTLDVSWLFDIMGGRTVLDMEVV